ncbi:MAG: hypothetical protein MJ124_01325 [Lachnospiraceae bacterium]|nr:hypothetical protein [Lachnospiraceae bacterium]
MNRTIDSFKMERPGLVEVGQEVELREGSLPNSVFYYVIEPAVAMSANFSLGERLVDNTGTVITKGTVTNIRETDRGFYVTVEFNY